MVCESGTLLRVAAIALAIVATYFAFNTEGRRAGICAAISALLQAVALTAPTCATLLG
jgi:hypothetical protein